MKILWKSNMLFRIMIIGLTIIAFAGLILIALGLSKEKSYAVNEDVFLENNIIETPSKFSDFEIGVPSKFSDFKIGIPNY